MRKTLIPLMLTAFVLFSLGLLNSAQNQEDAKFQKTLDSYLDAYWKFYPTAGTLAGYSKYNDRLEDLSSRAIEKRNDDLDALNQEVLAKINRGSLSPENQVDHEILVDALEMELFRHESLVPWEYNPLMYNDILLNSVQGLFGLGSLPLDARVKSATERMKEIPRLIKQAKDNLKTPAKIYTETAIAQFPVILNFYKTELPALAASASTEAKSKLMAEMSKVLSALEEYNGFLKGDLLGRSTGNFRLGDQAHLRLLRLTGQGAILLDELVARAKADYNNIRREMALVCIPFYKVMYPEVNIEQMNRPEEELRSIIIMGVFDKIKVEHPSKEEFISKAQPTAEQLRSFLTGTVGMTLPEEIPAIQTMKLKHRGLLWVNLQVPNPYENGGTSTVYIRPFPDDWPNDKTNAFLEEHNDFTYPFWVARKVYPGHFIPLTYAWKNSSLVRKLFPNQPLVQGWSAHVEEMLVFAGYGNYDLRLRLSQLAMQLKAAMDFQLELNIHQGGMTKEQAMNYMVRGGFQSEAEAERKWNLIALHPGEYAYPYIGYQEILDIEKDYKKLKGESFNKAQFLQKMISYGPIPMRLLKTRMAQ